MSPSPPIAVRRSRIQGRGVVATRDIAKDERIVEYTGGQASVSSDESRRPMH